MAEAMIPPEMRPKILSAQEEKNLELKSSLNLISVDSPERMKRKRSSNNVVIAIPAEIKRYKISQLCDAQTVRRIIEDISTALTRRDRLSAIGAACATFNHDVASVHDDEIQNHCADAALCKHLSFLLLQEQHNPSRKQLEEEETKKWKCNTDQHFRQAKFDEADEEIAYTCSALEMVFRGSASALAKSFEKFGPELLDLLLAVIYRKAYQNPSMNESNNKMTSMISFSGWFSQEMMRENSVKFTDMSSMENLNSSSNNHDMSIQKATKIMCHLARVGSTVESMAHHPGILKVLKDIIDSRNQNSEDQLVCFTNTDDESSINCLWILGNLACSPGNMEHMMGYPGLQKTLLNVIRSCNPTNYQRVHSPSFVKAIAAAGQAVRVFLNLSWTDENKTRMSENLELIDETIKLVSSLNQQSSKKVNSLVLSTRRHAIGTLRNIAATPSFAAKLRLCQYQNNILLTSLSKVITDKVQNDHMTEGWKEDLVMKERALATIYNLMCKETVNSIAMHDGLYNEISQVPNNLGKDAGDISKLVEKVLMSFKEHVKSDMECYNMITNAVVDNKPERVPSTTEVTTQGEFSQYTRI